MVFCLCLKTKWATVCQLCHKIDERMKTARDTHRDFVACFVWKKVRVLFPSMALRLAETRHDAGGARGIFVEVVWR
jgi:hypothetical protein